MSGNELDYVSREFVNFDDRSYRWIDLKRFDAEEAVKTVGVFAARHGGTTDETLAKLERVVFPLVREMSSRFRLRDLGETAHHDFGWVLDEFAELVLIDMPSRRLVLLVAAAD